MLCSSSKPISCHAVAFHNTNPNSLGESPASGVWQFHLSHVFVKRCLEDEPQKTTTLYHITFITFLSFLTFLTFLSREHRGLRSWQNGSLTCCWHILPCFAYIFFDSSETNTFGPFSCLQLLLSVHLLTHQRQINKFPRLYRMPPKRIVVDEKKS